MLFVLSVDLPSKPKVVKPNLHQGRGRALRAPGRLDYRTATGQPARQQQHNYRTPTCTLTGRAPANMQHG